MRRRFDWRYALGAALVALVATVVLGAFSLMGRPSTEDIALNDSWEECFGWSYELLEDGQVRSYEPTFEEGDYFPDLPEGIQAVRITRRMTEEIPFAELEWDPFNNGVEVFLDGELLHTDFRGQPRRGENGFLMLTDADWELLHAEQGGEWKQIRMSLPADYPGKELSVITYFPEDRGRPTPEYPVLSNDDAVIGQYVTVSVWHDAVMTIYALLALLIAAVFLLDIPNADLDAKTLLLCLYFLLLFLDQTALTYAGHYSKLRDWLNMTLLRKLYVVPLYLYLALRLKKRWRYPLCGAIAAWTLYECVQWFLWSRRGAVGTAEKIGPWALAVFLLVALASCLDVIARARQARRDRRRLAFYAVATAAIAAAYLLNRFSVWGGARDYLVSGLWVAVRMGSFEPVISLATDIVSFVALIVVISEFLRRTLRARQEIGVLQDRERQAMESYRRLLTAQDATNVLRHEMRHHMVALSGILGGGDAERAKRYVDAVAGDLEQLPTGRYSENLLVDVVAGSFLDRAWAQGIRVKHKLDVPPELRIADEDLSVFLSNMLQNALEACERMDEEAERYIRVDMRLRGNFLFIKCVNSAPEEADEGEERPGHGYGIPAMRRIAEKYNSKLVIERAPGEFTLKSDLFLRGSARDDERAGSSRGD